MSNLVSGKVDFYQDVDCLQIYTPLINNKTGSDNETLSFIFKLFNSNVSKFQHIITLLVSNYIKDNSPIPIKIVLPKKMIFGEIGGDNIVDFAYKFCDIITNRSDRKHKNTNTNYIMIYQLKTLFEFAKANNYSIEHDSQLERYIEYDSDEPVEIKLLSKFQSNLKNCIGMAILSELYYCDRLSLTMRDDYGIIETFDKLITDVITNLDKESLIGLTNKNFNHLAKYFGLIEYDKNESFEPMIFKSFIPSIGVEIHKNEIGFMDKIKKYKVRLHDREIKKWLNENF